MQEQSRGTRSSGRASNFRTNFIRNFVSDSAESSRFQIEEQILSDNADVDLVKLAQFAVKYHLPNNLRVSIWKLLLNVDSCFSEVKKEVAGHRTQEADILRKSLIVMQLTSSGNNISSLNDDTAKDMNSYDILRMIQLGDGKLLLNPDNPNDINFQAQLAIAKQMLLACEGRWCDAFWLTKTFDELVASVFTDAVLQKAAWETKEKLRAIDSNPVIAAINEHFLWTRIPFIFWFRSAGATMFSHETVLKLWDKVCSCRKDGLVALMRAVIETYILEFGNQIVQNFEEGKSDILEVQLTKDAEVALITLIVERILSSSRFLARR